MDEIKGIARVPREEDYDRRNVPIPQPVAVPQERDGRSTHRSGGNDDGLWTIHFNTVLPATFDERDHIITG